MQDRAQKDGDPVADSDATEPPGATDRQRMLGRLDAPGQALTEGAK